jgi:hypothetical protein
MKPKAEKRKHLDIYIYNDDEDERSQLLKSLVEEVEGMKKYRIGDYANVWVDVQDVIKLLEKYEAL